MLTRGGSYSWGPEQALRTGGLRKLLELAQGRRRQGEGGQNGQLPLLISNRWGKMHIPLPFLELEEEALGAGGQGKP